MTSRFAEPQTLLPPTLMVMPGLAGWNPPCPFEINHSPGQNTSVLINIGKSTHGGPRLTSTHARVGRGLKLLWDGVFRSAHMLHPNRALEQLDSMRSLYPCLSATASATSVHRMRDSQALHV